VPAAGFTLADSTGVLQAPAEVVDELDEAGVGAVELVVAEVKASKQTVFISAASACPRSG
jgi:ferredoxin